MTEKHEALECLLSEPKSKDLKANSIFTSTCQHVGALRVLCIFSSFVYSTIHPLKNHVLRPSSCQTQTWRQIPSHVVPVFNVLNTEGLMLSQS